MKGGWTTDSTIFALWLGIVIITLVIGWHSSGWVGILYTVVVGYAAAMIGHLEVQQTTARERARAEAIFITLDVMERDRKPMADR